MMGTTEEVTVADTLKTPKIAFTPKQKMRDAANAVELSIIPQKEGDGFRRHYHRPGQW